MISVYYKLRHKAARNCHFGDNIVVPRVGESIVPIGQCEPLKVHSVTWSFLSTGRGGYVQRVTLYVEPEITS